MEMCFFYIFGTIAIIGSIIAIINPFSESPITSAMALLLVFGALTGLFVLQGAYFVGFVQLVIYAGAIIVLLVMVSAVVGVEAKEKNKFLKPVFIGGIICMILMAILIEACLLVSNIPSQMSRNILLKDLSKEIITNYLVHFQVLMFILLIGIITVINLIRGGQYES